MISDKAQKFLNNLDFNESEMIINKLNSILDRPYSHIKKLTGSRFWRLRISKYRAIIDFVVEDNILKVLKIGHRKNVYD